MLTSAGLLFTRTAMDFYLAKTEYTGILLYISGFDMREK